MRRIDNREFVVCWMNSNSLEEVAKAMDISAVAANSKAVYLRKKGVKLPRMDRKPKDWQLEVAQLNALIKKQDARR